MADHKPYRNKKATNIRKTENKPKPNQSYESTNILSIQAQGSDIEFNIDANAYHSAGSNNMAMNAQSFGAQLIQTKVISTKFD